MLSPIKTVFMYYPIRSFMTIALMVIVSVFALKTINRGYENDKISKQTSVVLWLLINYSLFIIFFTVLGRRSLDYYRYNFDFGYSYQEIFILGDYTLATQLFVNILMFIPIGILCGIIVKKYAVIKTLLLGTCFSFIIEVLQLVLRRGYFEFDDLLSNAIGTLIGCVLVKMYYRLRQVK